MYCANCGSSINEDGGTCPKCEKSKNSVNISNGYPLSNLTARLFKIFFEVSLWITLILGLIIGGIIGNIANNAFGGLLIGGIISFVIIVVSGGLVSIFLKLSDNIEELKKLK
jgi:hypothetical protein